MGKRNKSTAQRSQQFINLFDDQYQRFISQKVIKKSQVMSLKKTLKNIVDCLKIEKSSSLECYNNIKNRITTLCNKQQAKFEISRVIDAVNNGKYSVEI